MADTTTPILGLVQPQVNASDNTWGDKLNDDLAALDALLADNTEITSTSGTITLSEAQQKVRAIRCTGTLIGNLRLDFDRKGVWLVLNNTAGAFTLTVGRDSQAGTLPTIAQGATAVVFHDGTDVWSTSSAVLGTAASKDTGTSGDKVPLLNAANTWSALQAIILAAAGPALTLESTDAGADPGPDLDLYRNSASPAASDGLGRVRFFGEDSAGAKIEYARFWTYIDSPTDGAATGTLSFQARRSGTLTDRAYIGAGLFMPGATGFDMGAGTINATAVYKNGVEIGVGRQTVNLLAAGMIARTTNGPSTYSTERVTNDIMTAGYGFDKDTEEAIQIAFPLPKGFNNSVGLVFRPYWTTAASAGTGNVIWGFRARYVRDDDAIDGAWGTAVEVTDGFLAAGDMHIAAETAACTPGGTYASGCMLFVEIYRKAANGSDTYSQDALLLAARMTYGTTDPTDT